MGCGVYWQQIKEVERAMRTLQTYGIPELSEAYQKLYAVRGRLLKTVGVKYPRVITQILRLVALSPGSITLWHDNETGFMTEARTEPGAPPVYKAAPDEVVGTLLKGELDHKLEKALMTPDDYVGE